ncbi:hypothetical protein BS333_09145 [Vibrio azureus]|nr:hypothetical protein BS333_09145 [Vibrio azureus]
MPYNSKDKEDTANYTAPQTVNKAEAKETKAAIQQTVMNQLNDSVSIFASLKLLFICYKNHEQM